MIASIEQVLPTVLSEEEPLAGGSDRPLIEVGEQELFQPVLDLHWESFSWFASKLAGERSKDTFCLCYKIDVCQCFCAHRHFSVVNLVRNMELSHSSKQDFLKQVYLFILFSPPNYINICVWKSELFFFLVLSPSSITSVTWFPEEQLSKSTGGAQHVWKSSHK